MADGHPDLRAVTTRPAEQIQAGGSGSFKVIYLGVNRLFQPASTGACAAVRRKYHLPERYLLSVGTLEPRKNFNILLHVLLRLQKMGLNTQLVLAGRKGWLFESFFQQLHRLGLAGQVLFLDYVDEADLPALYSAADLFVFPSLYEVSASRFWKPWPAACRWFLRTPPAYQSVRRGRLAGRPPGCRRLGGSHCLDSRRAGAHGGMRGLGFRQAERFTWEKTAAETFKVYLQAAKV